MISLLRNFIQSAWAYLHRPSLVESWKQRSKDEEYLRNQIGFLRQECESLSHEMEDNPYSLESLTEFAASQQNDEDRRAQEERRRGLNIACSYIFENRTRFKNSVPHLLEEYFTARKELEHYERQREERS